MIFGRTNTPAQLPAQSAMVRDLQDPLRTFAFAAGLCLVLVRFSELHQMVTYLTGVNLRLLYFVGVPAVVGMALSGGLRRAYAGRPAWYWTGFLVCMGLAAPFTSWKTASILQFLSYSRTEFVMLPVIAGLAVTWRECRMMMYAIAGAGFVSVIEGKIFADPDRAQRLSLDFGTLANANDYACHLILLLPIVLWLALKPGTWTLVRVLALGIVGAGLVSVIRTGSRGAMLALAATLLYLLYRGSARQRIAVLVLMPIMLAIALAAVPAGALQRIRSFGLGDAEDRQDESGEALESTEARKYVLFKSIEYTLQHPIFGVGPGQFANYEGQRSVVLGTHGYYHGTHNVFTQVSSECGIPALFFFVAGLVSSYRALSATYIKARARSDCGDIRDMAFCVLIAMAGFTVGATFLNLAYLFHFPALGGIAIAISRGAAEEMKRRESSQTPAAALPMAGGVIYRRSPGK